MSVPEVLLSQINVERGELIIQPCTNVKLKEEIWLDGIEGNG